MITQPGNRSPLSERGGSGTSLVRRPGTALTVAATTVALLGSGIAEAGTTVVRRADLRPIIDRTSLDRITVDGRLEPLRVPSRMAQILALAPLPLRTWAPVFGVTHTTISHWKDGQEPDRDQLDRILGALREASQRHSDLAAWLQAPIPGTELRPLDLLSEERWAAFRGAIRVRSAPAVDVDAAELVRRRRAQVSWVVPDVPIVVDA